MTTLSNGTTTITPTTVDGYEALQEARTIAHTIIGRAADDFTLRPAGPRTGTLKLVFDDAASADEARTLHAGVHVWTLVDPDVSTIGMQYVVEGGSISPALDDETRAVWIVSVPFREVLP